MILITLYTGNFTYLGFLYSQPLWKGIPIYNHFKFIKMIFKSGYTFSYIRLWAPLNPGTAILHGHFPPIFLLLWKVQNFLQKLSKRSEMFFYGQNNG